MAFMAMAIPILPGKTEAWRAWMSEMQSGGARHAAFVESRRSVGLHERTSLQQSPMGDLVIVVLEGDDPMRSFGEFNSRQDEFARWFLAKVQEFHGVDLTQGMPGPPPELLLDTEA